jgi:hypothetical protein
MGTLLLPRLYELAYDARIPPAIPGIPLVRIPVEATTSPISFL